MEAIISKPMPTWIPCRYNCGGGSFLPPNMKVGPNAKVLMPCKKCAKDKQYYDTKIKGK